jgi:hypothetical protein
MYFMLQETKDNSIVMLHFCFVFVEKGLPKPSAAVLYFVLQETEEDSLVPFLLHVCGEGAVEEAFSGTEERGARLRCCIKALDRDSTELYVA